MILKMHNVTRIHGEGHTRVAALVNANLALDRGELVAVMGPSGSGKSTLLALAGGLDQPTAGKVYVDDVDLATLSVAKRAALRRHRIGYVFQQFNLIEGLTAAENVSLPLELDGVAHKIAMKQAALALERVEISELADRFPEEMSGGEQQRVAIARAVVGTRTLLLADEPTGALDTATGETVLRMMRRHCELGGCGILVTHDSRFAAWADRIVFLRDGRIVDESEEWDSPATLMETAQ